MQDWSAQPAHVSARSRLYSAASSSAASKVLTSAAETLTASVPGGPGGCGTVGRDDGTTTQGVEGASRVPSYMRATSWMSPMT